MGPVSLLISDPADDTLTAVYPIRTTVTDHTRNNPSAAINRHEHPGYSVPTAEHARQNPLETYTKGHELYTKHEELRADFSKAMRRAKICVFDASLERKMIRKVRYCLSRPSTRLFVVVQA